MSQLGMQMPGSQRGIRPRMNVYTGLALVAVVCLAAAVVMVARAGMQIGPKSVENPMMRAISVHGDKVELPE
ncbi:MAG: hypothetical protein R3B46_06185 [Phycisphaerales bacterium]|mgnify:CR=1 FL=1